MCIRVTPTWFEGYKNFMNQIFKVGVSLCALAVLATAAMADQLTGTWHGHIKIDVSKMTAPPAAQKAKMMDAVSKAQQMEMTLNLKADHTFTVNTPNRPNQTGTWSVSGSSVTLQAQSNGKNIGPSQVFTLAKNQKTMYLSQKDPGTKKEAIMISFKR